MNSIKGILVALLFSLNLMGCSLIGLSINSYTTPKTNFNPYTMNFALIDSATSISVVLKNGLVISGEFDGLSTSALNVRTKLNSGLMGDESILLKDIKEITISKFNYTGLAAILIGISIDAFIITESLKNMKFTASILK